MTDGTTTAHYMAKHWVTSTERSDLFLKQTDAENVKMYVN